MDTAQPKYDVAISFLTQDESIANAFYVALGEGLEVFFYPRDQEALAGTNGLESMRTPFVDDSRVIVVLYREPWGKTPWTGVEQAAIQDGCLRHGWQSLFFVMLDKTSAPPAWLPQSHVRFNFADFGLEQAVGAIKARVQEGGGSIKPLSAVRRAELYQQEAAYQEERKKLLSPSGRTLIGQNAAKLFAEIESLCSTITATGNIAIQFAADPRQCHLRNHRVSLIVTLSDFPDIDLVVREFDKRLAFLGERLAYLNGQPREIKKTSYLPELNRARQYGWAPSGQSQTFVSSEDLANAIVSEFIDLAAKADTGDFSRPPLRPQRYRR